MPPPLAHSANPSGHTHPLSAHSEAVAELAAEFGELFGSAEYARCAGLWHDLGKNAPGFQERLALSADAHVEGGRTGYGDHASAGAIHAVNTFGDAAHALALVIAGHHGGLADWAELRTGKLRDPDLARRLDACVGNPSAFIPNSERPEPPGFLAGPTPPAQVPARKRACEFWIRMLFSCLVDADFLDTEAHFDPAKASARGGYPGVAGLKEKFDRFVSKFAGAAGKVNEARARVLSDCRRAGRDCARGVFALTAPTGCGKTLAGMAFALEHAVAQKLGRVIVVLPYTSIIDQNAKEYADVFGGANVIQHHASLDPKHETHRNRTACENWDAPVIVTTSVQFIESLFSNKTSRCRKLHNVARSVVIFDEVQTLPVGHLSPVLDVLKELVKNYRVSLVLSTATQPALRHRESFTCGFERVTEIVSDVSGTFKDLKRVSVIWPDDLTTPVTWEDLSGRLTKHDEVLCVTHQRGDARALAELVPDAIHLSALMCPAHRLEVIGRVKALLEENRQRRQRGEAIRPVQVISTQLIEAGVDLDFPVVYRAAGGLDSIAQAAGRCNREGKLDAGEVFVFVAPSEPPPGMPQTGLDVTRTMRAGEPALDALEPGTFDGFFKLVYARQKCDLNDIQNKREAWMFERVSKDFAVIEEDGAEAVVVPHGDAVGLLADLRAQGPSRERLRALQPYLVKVYPTHYQELNEAGAVEVIGDLVKAIRVPTHAGLYDERFGLRVKGPFAADAGALTC